MNDIYLYSNFYKIYKILKTDGTKYDPQLLRSARRLACLQKYCNARGLNLKDFIDD